MNMKAYSHIRLEKFLKDSARTSNKAYQLKHCVKATVVPILSKDEAGTVPASFSFIVEKKDSFASLEIGLKRIAPRLMLIRMKLTEVSPQLMGRGLSGRGFPTDRDFGRLK